MTFAAFGHGVAECDGPNIDLSSAPNATFRLSFALMFPWKFSLITRRTLTSVAAALIALPALCGCTSIPEGQRAVTGFEVKGNDKVDTDDLEKKLATKKTTKFMLLFRGILYEYEIYDRYSFERDLARIERYYRARGYYDAKVRVARVHDVGDDKAEIEVQVDEGEPVRIAHIELEWTEQVPDKARRAAERATREAAKQSNHIFDEEKFEAGEQGIVRALGNNGYAAAAVKRDAQVDLVRREAVLTYRVTPGEPSVLGEIKFEGNGEIPVSEVRRTFDVKPGTPYSVDALEESRQALLDLGVFSTVDVVPDLGSDQREATGQRRKIVPVTVRLEVAKLRALRLGGGVEFSTTRLDVHGLVGWTNQNTFGNLRRVELTFQPGVVFYPTALSSKRLEMPEKLLPFQRTRATLRRPAFIESRTTGLLTAQYAIYPQLFPQKTDNVIGYHEIGTTAGLQRAFGKYMAQPGYGFQANFPYNAIGRAPVALDPVLVSYVEYYSYLDFRNDPLRPTKGAYFANTLQYAGGPLAGTADDVKIQPEARGYLPLSKRFAIAGRFAVGFLFPRNYGRAMTAAQRGPNGLADYRAQRNLDDAAATSELSRDYQTLYFRGLFGGGPTSNRGYALRGIGPHAVIPFVVPTATINQQNNENECRADNPRPPRECLLPVGGLSQWEASAELRMNVTGPLLAAVFCDAGDVGPEQVQLRFDRLHFSCGAGARVDTPAGPIRLDIGYRIPGLQTLGSSFGEGDPGDLLGAPIAINFGIGEAF